LNIAIGQKEKRAMSKSGDKLSTKPYKGSRDFYPDDMRFRNWTFNLMRRTAESFGYEEYDGPMLELFKMYAAKSGEELVNEQLYHFKDRADRHVAIRPEMTPTLARMVAAKIQAIPQPIRWFSIPNLWRYEKPQRGRLREHWQFNVDIFGIDSMLADLEIIEVAIRVMLNIGANSDDFKIRISNRRLLNGFLSKVLELNQTGRSAVCKVIDKKEKIQAPVFEDILAQNGLSQDKIAQLKIFMDYDTNHLTDYPVNTIEGADELVSLIKYLQLIGLEEYCSLDLSIVRGLDYYTSTVFEMYDLHPDNRRALFGGGRYDNLVGLFSNQELSGTGFGMGDVTVQNFMKVHQLMPELPHPVEIFVALYSRDSLEQSLIIAKTLRNTGYRVINQLEPIKLGKQFKQADSRNIPIVVLQGPDEIHDNKITIKHMPSGEQVTIPMEKADIKIQKWLRKS